MYDLIITFEILEHLDDWKRFLNRVINNLKPNGKVIISTINRNALAKYTAINLAENFLKWIPKNTHDYNKFIKPEEIKKFSLSKNLQFKNLKGLNYKPIFDTWEFSNNFYYINYFCTIEKIN